MSESTDLQQLAAEATGLHPGLTSLLRGETLAELTAHATSLRAVSIPAPAPDDAAPAPAAAAPAAPGPGPGPSGVPEDGFDGGARREPPRPRAETIRHLAKTNPRRFNDMLDSGEINLADLGARA